jgi:co-chaperonin GroES (HSP10)
MRARGSFLLKETAIGCLLITFLCIGTLRTSGQKKTWQAGTVLEVKAHQPESDNNTPKKYDISIKVGKKVYVTLYASEEGQPDPEYYVGMQRTVLIEGDTLKINDLLGHTHSLHIVSSKDAPSNSK